MRSSTAPKVDPRVRSIEAIRARRGLSHEELCRAAGVSCRTWAYLRRGAQAPKDFTIEKLQRALDRAEKAPVNAIAALHRLALILIAGELQIPAVRVLAHDPSQNGGRNRDWVEAARAWRCAIYLLAVELQIGNAALARAIGTNRQNVKQARDQIEDLRDDDPRIEGALDAVAAMLRGANTGGGT